MGLLQTTSKFMVKSAAYIVRNGPVTEQERWRRTGFSPSTSLPRFALVQRHWRQRRATADSEYLLLIADYGPSRIEAWTFRSATAPAGHTGPLLA